MKIITSFKLSIFYRCRIPFARKYTQYIKNNINQKKKK